MDMCKLVGRNAARLRDQAGLTQEQLAERSGFSQQYISDLECGKIEPDGGDAL
jgi:transcriptional regulator with XRE-family HTH domain